MLLVLGKKNCNACEVAKIVLKKKGVEFEYRVLDDEVDKEYIKLAFSQGKIGLPLIIDGDNVLSVKDVIDRCL